MTGDEFNVHRDLACLILARMIPLTSALKVPTSWMAMTLAIAKDAVRRLLPDDHLVRLLYCTEQLLGRQTMDAADATEHPLAHSLVARLTLVMAFLPHLGHLDPAFEPVLHTLLATLLRPEILECVSAHVVDMLTALLPRTNGNRRLVEALHLPLVRRLYDLPETVPPTTPPGSWTYHARYKPVLSQFLSAWCERPADSVILALPDRLFDASKEGYVYRRRKWLMTQQKFRACTIVSHPLAAPTLTTMTAVARPVLFADDRDASVGYDSAAMAHIRAALLADVANSPLHLATQDPVWEAEVLSLSIPHGQTLHFLRPPYTRQVFVTNNLPSVPTTPASAVDDSASSGTDATEADAPPSTSDLHRNAVPFHIQVWPPEYFSVHPASGILAPGENRAVNITFCPRPETGGGGRRRRTREVEGLIRLRDRFGFPVSRFPLKGTLLPLVYCPTDSMDFGYCVPGDWRTLCLTVHNLTNTECNCAITLENGAVFQVSPPQVILQPNEEKLLRIKFLPQLNSAPGEHVDTLVIETDCSETHRVALRGVGKSSFTVVTTKLAYGAVDMTWSPVVKPLWIQNHMDAPLPISFLPSTTELVVPDNVVLDPGEKRKVPVAFAAAFNGTRTERMFVTAPFGVTTGVDVTAVVGRTIYAPVHEHVYLAPAAAGKGEPLMFPIVNAMAGQGAQTVLVQVPPYVACRLLDARLFNNEPVAIELAPYAEQKGGYLVTFAGMGTAVLGLQMNRQAASSGRWITELQLHHVKPAVTAASGTASSSSPVLSAPLPKTVFISRHLLYCVQLSQGYLAKESFLKDARQLLSLTSPTDFLNGNGANQDAGDGADVPSSCFEVDPVALYLHGNHKLGKFQCQGTVSITNVTSQRQNYHLLVPPWLKLPVPYDGSIPALSALDIPFTVELPPQFNTADRQHDVFLGFIAVVDDRTTRGVSTCAVRAVASHPVQLEVSSTAGPIRFPATKVLSKVVRKIPLRNCLPIEGVWEGRIYLTEAQNRSLAASSNALNRRGSMGPLALMDNAGSGDVVDGGASDASPAAAADEVRNPFSLVTAKFTLKPYSVAMVEVTMQATATGLFVSQLEYELYSVQKYSSTIPKFSFTVVFECAVGKVELDVNPDQLAFPDTVLGKPSKQLITADNTQMLPAHTRFFSTSRALHFQRADVTVPPNKSALQVVKFVPTSIQHEAGVVHVAAHLWNTIVPFSGRGGTFNLSTDAGLNLLGHAPVLDVGPVIYGRRQSFRYTLTNHGTLDLRLLHVYAEPASIFSAEIIADEDLAHPGECNFLPDQSEVDWDEVDVRFTADAAAVGATGARLLTGRMSRRRDRKSVFGRGTVTLALQQSVFPMLVRPMHACVLEIQVHATDLKQLQGQVLLKVVPLNGDAATVPVAVRATSIRPLGLSEKRIDFGICDALHRHVRTTKVSNPASVPLHWTMEVKELYLTHPKTLKEQSIEGHHHPPIAFFPARGYLLPGQHELVDVVVHSNLSYSDINAQCVLASPGGACTVPFAVHAIAATSRLTASETALQFGVLGVGKSRSKRITLINSGGLPCTFITHSSHPVYFCEPEQGVIDGGGDMDVDVTFNPRFYGQFDAMLQIRYYSTEGYFYPSATVRLVGAGGYPDLYVHTKEVDFGTAIFGNDNAQIIEVENKGDAEAQVSLLSYHPSIFLNQTAPVIPPKTLQHLHVVFRPTFIETLNTKLFIKSSDSRSDVFLVKVKGHVGVSSLSVSPLDQFQNLDFGTCLVNGTYKKTFKLRNMGNIPVSFNLVLVQDPDDAVAHPYSVDLVSGHAKVEEEFTFTVAFKPLVMRSYAAKLELRYDHHVQTTVVRGVGGQMMISLLPATKLFEFGLCRINRSMRKEILIDNKGNYGTPYQAYIINNPGGFRVVNPNGFCWHGDKTAVFIEFVPTHFQPVACTLRIECGDEARELELTGTGAESKLALLDAEGNVMPHSAGQPPQVDLGIHPLGVQHQVAFKLVNEGPFGIDFFIEPFRVPEFLLTPQRGYIEAESSALILLSFSPTAESQYRGVLQVLWENAPLRVDVLAAGGIGKLDVKFATQADVDVRCIDFGMVPLQSTLEKRFYLTNDGLVDIAYETYVTSPDFVITTVGEPFHCTPKDLLGVLIPATKRPVWQFSNAFKGRLKPKHGIEVAVRFTAKQQTSSKGTLCVLSDAVQVNMELRAKGGTIAITHKGSLSLEDIAVRHTAMRKIVIMNSGSIPALLNFGWSLIRGGENAGSVVELTETFGALDPRNGWARAQLIKDTDRQPGEKLTAADYWWMVRRIVSRVDPAEEQEERLRTVSRMGSSYGLSMNASTDVGLAPSTGGGGDMRSMLGLFKSSTQTNAARKHGYRIHSKRRQICFNNIMQHPVSSQILSQIQPFIRVDPPSALLPGYGEVEIAVQVNLPTEEVFLATLLSIPNVPNTPTYEIALTATPKLVSVVMDDSRPIDFGCQQIGHREVINRIFTNVGNKAFSFLVEQENRSITVFPNRGHLDVGKSVMIQFAFEPVDESLQTAPTRFIPDCSQPIRIKMSGSGGQARMSLYKYKRFDFGHCMIGKDTGSSLPIANEGNAILHLTKFDLIPSDSFFKGAEWPKERVSIMPGQTYHLPLVFNPRSESPAPGKLLVGNSNEWYDIQLTGVGREAVLIVTKVILDFADCLIGNTYTQKLGLKNVGDVNYPVSFKLEAKDPLLEFIPSSMTIQPFSESTVQIVYKPAQELKLHTSLSIISPYSVNTVPVILHAGFARLTLSDERIDFGMFEKSTRPSRAFTIRNTGSVNIAYSVRQNTKPHLFQLTNPKGTIPAGKEVVIVASYVQAKVGHFAETLVIKTELQSAQYAIKILGQCEEAIVKYDEFQVLNMGTCPVLEATSKPLTITNYGKFPLKYQIKNAYPIKIMKAAGEVPGESTEKIMVVWNPSGGYELRTQLHLVTNVGTFQIIVRGKASFPELVLQNNYFDFGVCAVGSIYTETLELFNKGKVALHWSIPNVRDCYSVSCAQGTLGPKEGKNVLITFRPTAVGRYGSSFIIESKGLNFKEVALIGVGGVMVVDIPSNVEIGQCPCDHPILKSFVITNRGDVPLHASFDTPPPTSADSSLGTCPLVSLPPSMVVGPGKAAKVHFSIKATIVGPLETRLLVKTRERSYTVHMRGVGVKINLSSHVTELLDLDRSYEAKNPLEVLQDSDPLDYWMARMQRGIPTALDGLLKLPLEDAMAQLNAQPHAALPDIWRFASTDDVIMDHVCQFPVPRIVNEDLTYLSNPTEPVLTIPMEPLLARPPPFPPNKALVTEARIKLGYHKA
ncbi:hypothetical protein GGF32_009093 [Allomyces javanicus]|nr:hypothetical protein GGF32_009093 [Allomyces javanicus]